MRRRGPTRSEVCFAPAQRWSSVHEAKSTTCALHGALNGAVHGALHGALHAALHAALHGALHGAFHTALHGTLHGAVKDGQVHLSALQE